MSEEYNNYENSSSEPQYTQAPESQNSYNSNNYNNNYGGYGGGPVNDYTSGKGQGKGLGIASMVCGILAIVTICCSGVIPYVPIVLGVVGIVLGIVQIVKNESKGMAIAGIICGALGLIGYILLLVIGLYALNMMGGELNYDELLRQLEEMENSLMIRFR